MWDVGEGQGQRGRVGRGQWGSQGQGVGGTGVPVIFQWGSLQIPQITVLSDHLRMQTRNKRMTGMVVQGRQVLKNV